MKINLFFDGGQWSGRGRFDGLYLCQEIMSKSFKLNSKKEYTLSVLRKHKVGYKEIALQKGCYSIWWIINGRQGIFCPWTGIMIDNLFKMKSHTTTKLFLKFEAKS